MPLDLKITEPGKSEPVDSGPLSNISQRQPEVRNGVLPRNREENCSDLDRET